MGVYLNVWEWLSGIEMPDFTLLNKGLEMFVDDKPLEFFYIMLGFRVLSVLLAVAVVYRCVRSLLSGRIDPEIWAYLELRTGERVAVHHWENVIGRSHSADIVIPLSTVSRSHATLMRGGTGIWQIADIGSKGGTLLNGDPIQGKADLAYGDVITVGGVEAVFTLVSREEEAEIAGGRTKPGHTYSPSLTMVLLTILQGVLSIELVGSKGFSLNVGFPFAALSILMWVYFIIFRTMRRRGFEVDILGFFLTSLGFAVAASSSESAPLKQAAALVVGLALYVFLSWMLRDLRRSAGFRWPMAVAALLLLGVNLVFGKTVFGARNWITIAGFTFQPSEFVKVAYVFAGGAALDRLFARRNVYMFIAFTGVCIGALALMGDFGGASIFFAAFLVIVYLRSGDIATMAFIISGVVLGGFVVLSAKPYIARRFAVWGHVWENAHSTGFQQTRTMSAAASGGMIGFGPDNGWLKGIAAADTDLVFGMLCEEMGLIVALCAVIAVAALAVFVIKYSAAGRSSFYVICANSATAMLVFQMMLNIFGSVDILPLTGVTFPFVSNGGSSLVACWGLMAFVKAVDTRQNASFAVQLPKKVRRGSDEKA